MSWLGEAPTQSRLAYQIKVGTSKDGSVQPEDVPEPGTVLALVVGAGALGLTRRRREETA